MYALSEISIAPLENDCLLHIARSARSYSPTTVNNGIAVGQRSFERQVDRSSSVFFQQGIQHFVSEKLLLSRREPYENCMNTCLNISGITPGRIVQC